MAEVIVFYEGPTEEKVVKQVIAPSLRQAQLHLKPQTLKTSQESRGALAVMEERCPHFRGWMEKLRALRT